ncbi:MAG: transcription termination factor Rho [Ornithinimicrobium sp.]
MTETIDVAPRAKTGSLSSMRLADLQGMASGMGIAVGPKMRKADLVSAIRSAQGGKTSSTRSGAKQPASAKQPPTPPTANDSSATTEDSAPSPAEDRTGQQEPAARGAETEGRQRDRSENNRGGDSNGENKRDGGNRGRENGGGDGNRNSGNQGDGNQGGSRNRGNDNRGDDNRGDDSRGDGNRGSDSRGDGNRGSDSRGDGNRGGENRGDGNRGKENRAGDNRGDDDGRGGRRRNRQRGRDRKRGRSGQGGGRENYQDEPEGSYSEEDVLVPVAGIVDVLDSYAFIRTTGYLPGATDIYVPMGMVRRNGLRKGDAVAGAIKAPGHEQEQVQAGGKNNRGKFNALVRLDTVNGMSPDQAKQRPEFGKLTPLYPQARLRLETDNKNLTTRIIDLVAPIGKGQRGLIVSPPKAGKTLVLQAIANAITTNNPEVHLMIVLVDERPEEVTDMQRTVNGEVIASTFDRPAEDHTTVAELAIERAKRLVEMGGDVVVLLDSITRLGRAYNLAAPASGRILSGGVDSSALYPPKRFFGAARNIEEGGSLTILATALVETGSKMDEVIFEEFKGTGNMELRLSRQLADRRIFPAVDVNPSGTRREEILMSSEELKIAWKLRRVLTALDSQQSLELLLNRLRNTRNNYEFLTQVQQTSSIKLDDED